MTLDESSTPPPDEGGTKAKGARITGPKITKKTAVVGAAIGIGSAAIVAALLYANRNSGPKG